MPEPFAPSVHELAVPPGESPMPSSFIEMLDAEPMQSTSPEYIAAWWDESMDTSSWWTNESITPLHAALILSGHNPNDGTDVAMLEAAEKTTSGGIGPNEFRGLKNTFEGASNGQPRTLGDWVKYAQQHKKKIHLWLGKWLQARGTTVELLTDSPDAALLKSPGAAPSPAASPMPAANADDLQEKPWLIKDPRDPEPKGFQPWYTPARYFARALVRADTSLLDKTGLLAEKIVTAFDKVRIKKRGGRKSFSNVTIKKALSNIDFS